jgi:hypothetical protein
MSKHSLGTLDQNLDTLWGAIKLYYESNKVPCRFSCMSWRMFAGPDNGYPKLKGKASEVRHLNFALDSIWEDAMDENDELHVLVKVALNASTRMERILDDNADQYKLPPIAADAFAEATLTYVQAQNRLANWGGSRLFNLTMKHHYLVHIAARAKFLNPRLGWCFLGEDFMGHMRELAASCLAGVPRGLRSKKIATKMVLALHCTLSKA